MKVLKTKVKGIETWLLLTNKGTLVGKGFSEAAVRAQALKLGVTISRGN